MFSTPALKISSCHQQTDNKAPLHITSGDSPVPPWLGTGQEGISQHPACQGGGLQPGPLCASAMVFLLQYVCLPISELGTSLGSPIPGLRRGLARSHAANSAKGSKLCTSSKIQHPSPRSSQPVKATHGNQSVPSAPAPEHPAAASRHVPVLAHSTSQSLAMVRWRKANLKSQFQPCGCRSGPRWVSQPSPKPAEGCFGERIRS